MKRLKIICIPHAGGAASSYVSLKKLLDKYFDVYCIELPGRGKRFREKFCDSKDECIQDLYESTKKIIDDSPYVILGHSLGSWLAYDLCLKIESSNLPKPLHLFCSGNIAPPSYKKTKVTYTLDNEDFIKNVMKLGGIPDEVYKNDTLRDIFIPIIRADYKISDTYEREYPESKIKCNLTIFTGAHDKVTNKGIENWSSCTDKQCNFVKFEGGHFFIYEKPEAVAKAIFYNINYDAL